MMKQRKTSESSQDSVETDNLLPRNEDYLEQKVPKISLSKTIKRITKGLAILGNPRAIKNY